MDGSNGPTPCPAYGHIKMTFITCIAQFKSQDGQTIHKSKVVNISWALPIQ